MLDWIFPQEIEKTGKIKVLKFQGKFSVTVNGIEQSGPWVKKVWSKVPLEGKNVLILGYGCGVISELLSENSKITGMEIDPKMVKIGRKYFKPKGKVLIGDAQKVPNGKFDLILVDLYVGQNFPKKFASPEFLQKLTQTVSKNGLVVFNRLTTKNANFEPEKFIDKLEKYLKIEKTIKVDFNQFFVCSRRES